jgi:hypothetical protein
MTKPLNLSTMRTWKYDLDHAYLVMVEYFATYPKPQAKIQQLNGHAECLICLTQF